MRRREFLGLAAAAGLPAAVKLEDFGIMLQCGPTEASVKELTGAARTAGFTRAQIRCPWSKLSQEYWASLPKWFEQAGIRVDVVGAYLNACAPENLLMECRREDMDAILDLTGRLGARQVIVWSGGYGKGIRGFDPRNHTPEAETAVVRVLESFAPRLEKARLGMSMETLYALVCPDAEALARVLDRLPPAFGAVLDPPNLIPPPRYANRDRELVEMVRLLRNRVGVVHFKDVKLRADGASYDFPGPLGGELNYPLFLKEIRKLSGNPPLVAEHLQPAEFAAARSRLLDLIRKV